MSKKNTDNWLVHDHRRFEETVKQCELAAGAEDWKTAVQLFNSVKIDDLQLHIQMEDEDDLSVFQTGSRGTGR
ncbi:hypothetical protein [Thiohalophilus sp.]|uniref:hypothetical protein n=1 Tax=Thiohalophilus sp. TaxID=3028392 RepID=UPI002ACD552F|nr:hypothetical protein [Thiohalophilus sp.]MDZ7803250.1 hypothetical protein [Thiohalophilus sp.]